MSTESPFITDFDIFSKFMDQNQTTPGDIRALEVFVKPYELLFKKYDKILIVSGDSFVHGDELADRLFIEDVPPDLPNLMTNPSDKQPDASKKALSLYTKWDNIAVDFRIKRQQQYDSLSMNEKITFWQRERELAFPKTLQDLRPDVLIINISGRGQSTERSTRVIFEVAFLLKRLFPDKLIESLCGMSFPDRTEERITTGYEEFLPHFHNPHNMWYQEYSRYYMEWYDDDTLMERYVENLLKFIGKMEMINVKIHFVLPQHCWNVIRRPIPVWTESELDFTDSWVEAFERYNYIFKSRLFPIQLPSNDTIKYLKSKNISIRHVGGHYTKPCHDLLAESLSEIICHP